MRAPTLAPIVLLLLVPAIALAGGIYQWTPAA